MIGVSVFTGVLLLWGFLFFRETFLLDKRNQLISERFGKNLEDVGSEIIQQIELQISQIRAIADRQDIPSHLKNINATILHESELSALTQIDIGEALYYLDENLVRHNDQLSPAVRQFARNSIDDVQGSSRAVRVDGQWKVFISSPLVYKDELVGLVLLQQSLDPFGEMLTGGNTQQGSLHLEQIEANKTTTRLLTVSDSNISFTGGDLSPLSRIHSIRDSNWQLLFEPTALLRESLRIAEKPFWYASIGVLSIWLLVLHFLNMLRMNRGNSEISIFTSQSQDVSTISLPAQKEEKVGSGTTESPNASETPDDMDKIEFNDEILDAKTDKLSSPDDLDEDLFSEAELDFLEQSDLLDEEDEEKYINDDKKFVLPDVVFRDYDIRGLSHEEITEEFALRLGKTVGSLVLRRGNNALYLGRDARSTSEPLAIALREGVISTGCNVIDLGQIITPALNFAIHYSGQSSCGVMVTASHNSSEFNGFKIIVQGQVLSGENLQLLKPIMGVENFTEGQGEYFSRLVIPQYVRQIFEDVGFVREFKIVIDGANSISGPVAVELFESLGCEVIPLYCNVDPSFPNHQPNPSDEFNLIDLRARVASEDADLGFAFDGDGDRLVVVSKSGKVCWPDQLMMLFSRDVLENAPGASIVFDVKSSQNLAAVIREYKGQPVMCRTGHAHVRKAVSETNAPLGGEFSGHIFFNDRRKCFDDGLYAGARLLEILSTTFKTLDHLLEELNSGVYTAEILIPVADNEKFFLITKIADECEFKGSRINRLDGLRVEYPQGWGLVRASNTSANLTLRFEADDHNVLGHIKQTFKYKLSKFIPNIEDYL